MKPPAIKQEIKKNNEGIKLPAKNNAATTAPAEVKK